MKIPFVVTPKGINDLIYVKNALDSGFVEGNGPFTKKCHDLLERSFNVQKVLLTTSCTDALEMSSFLINPEPGDEFILPSYTFSSTATAFLSRNMVPVFCDIKEDTLNIDETKIESLITNKTKAIVVVHYAGIIANMDEINRIAKKYNIIVIEDAAQAVNSKYKGKYAGTLGDFGTYSFHKTKSYSCGEGGALLINNQKYNERSEFLWEKGTDRSKVIQGLKNKYWWVDQGSSFLPSDIIAALLLSQLENLASFQTIREKLFNEYNNLFLKFVKKGIKKIIIPSNVESNYHAFWVIFNNKFERDNFIEKSVEKNIYPYIGYIPLHSSPMGIKLGGDKFNLPITDKISERIARLPFYLMSDEEIKHTISNFNMILEDLFSQKS